MALLPKPIRRDFIASLLLFISYEDVHAGAAGPRAHSGFLVLSQQPPRSARMLLVGALACVQSGLKE